MVMAALASVTVSMAADTIGMASSIFLVSFVLVSASLGNILLRAGRRRTSSNVKAKGNSFFMSSYGYLYESRQGIKYFVGRVPAERRPNREDKARWERSRQRQ